MTRTPAGPNRAPRAQYAGTQLPAAATPSPSPGQKRAAPGSTPSTRTRQKKAGAAQLFPVGTEVELFHRQRKVWQPGVVTGRRVETGETWPMAQGWRAEWTHYSGGSMESIEVCSSTDAPDALRWDASVSDALPNVLWASTIRHRREGIHEPQTVAEGQVFREDQTRAAVTSVRGQLSDGVVTMQVDETTWTAARGGTGRAESIDSGARRATAGLLHDIAVARELGRHAERGTGN